jgi:4-hydroxy-4-methyl-2-oxoglutarate aldolase
MPDSLTAAQIDALKRFDTCTIANAVELLDVRMRNEGFADASVRSLVPCPQPVVGHAVTARIRCSSPPMRGGAYVDRTDWWDHIVTVSGPRIVVIEDVDDAPGTGAFLGEVHAAILQALGCVAAVTNGSVRDVPAIEASGFKLFARHLSVSHAYVHIVEFGGPVTVGGLRVSPGDILHADAHGVLSVPKGFAAQVPDLARMIVERERRVLELCRSADFSVKKLREAVKGVFN